jgi:hypothetical protein
MKSCAARALSKSDRRGDVLFLVASPGYAEAESSKPLDGSARDRRGPHQLGGVALGGILRRTHPLHIWWFLI